MTTSFLCGEAGHGEVREGERTRGEGRDEGRKRTRGKGGVRNLRERGERESGEEADEKCGEGVHGGRGRHSLMMGMALSSIRRSRVPVRYEYRSRESRSLSVMRIWAQVVPMRLNIMP